MCVLSFIKMSKSTCAIQKLYAVHKGHDSGIYTSWDQVQKQIAGFVNPEFKKCATMEEAKHFFMYGDKLLKEIVHVTEIGKNQPCFVPDVYHRFSIGVHLKTPGTIFIHQMNITNQVDVPTISVPDHIVQLGTSFMILFGVVKVLEYYHSGITHGSINQSLHNERLDIAIVGDLHAYNILTNYMEQWKSSTWKDSRGQTVKGQSILSTIDILSRDLIENQVIHWMLKKNGVETAQTA